MRQGCLRRRRQEAGTRPRSFAFTLVCYAPPAVGQVARAAAAGMSRVGQERHAWNRKPRPARRCCATYPRTHNVSESSDSSRGGLQASGASRAPRPRKSGLSAGACSIAALAWLEAALISPAGGAAAARALQVRTSPERSLLALRRCPARDRPSHNRPMLRAGSGDTPW